MGVHAFERHYVMISRLRQACQNQEAREAAEAEMVKLRRREEQLRKREEKLKKEEELQMHGPHGGMGAGGHAA